MLHVTMTGSFGGIGIHFGRRTSVRWTIALLVLVCVCSVAGLSNAQLAIVEQLTNLRTKLANAVSCDEISSLQKELVSLRSDDPEKQAVLDSLVARAKQRDCRRVGEQEIPSLWRAFVELQARQTKASARCERTFDCTMVAVLLDEEIDAAVAILVRAPPNDADAQHMSHVANSRASVRAGDLTGMARSEWEKGTLRPKLEGVLDDLSHRAEVISALRDPDNRKLILGILKSLNDPGMQVFAKRLEEQGSGPFERNVDRELNALLDAVKYNVFVEFYRNLMSSKQYVVPRSRHHELLLRFSFESLDEGLVTTYRRSLEQWLYAGLTDEDVELSSSDTLGSADLQEQIETVKAWLDGTKPYPPNQKPVAGLVTVTIGPSATPQRAVAIVSWMIRSDVALGPNSAHSKVDQGQYERVLELTPPEHAKVTQDAAAFDTVQFLSRQAGLLKRFRSLLAHINDELPAKTKIVHSSPPAVSALAFAGYPVIGDARAPIWTKVGFSALDGAGVLFGLFAVGHSIELRNDHARGQASLDSADRWLTAGVYSLGAVAATRLLTFGYYSIRGKTEN